MSENREVLETLRRIETLLLIIANNTAKEGHYHFAVGTAEEQKEGWSAWKSSTSS